MCVIIGLPAKRTISKEILQNCYDNNPHGFGIMAAVNGKIEVTKSLGDFNAFMKEWKAYPRDVNRAVHFRIKTHGAIDVNNCHPFLANDELAIMHNGIIDTPIVQQGMSDTFNFVRFEVAPLVEEWPNAFSSKHFMRLMERLTDTSKLLFMDNDGGTKITFAEKWHKAGGCWFSNEHSLAKRKVYSAPSTGNYGCNITGRSESDVNEDWWDDLERNNSAYLNALKKEANEVLGTVKQKKSSEVGDKAVIVNGRDVTNVLTGPSLTIAGQKPILSVVPLNLIDRVEASLKEAKMSSDLIPHGKTVAEHEKDLADKLKADEDAKKKEEQELKEALGQDIIITPPANAEAEDDADYVEQELTISELCEMPPEDICEWVEENPISATEVIMVLLGRV